MMNKQEACESKQNTRKFLELQSKQHALDRATPPKPRHTLPNYVRVKTSEDVVAKLMKDPAASLRDPSFAETQLELKTRIEHLTEGIQRYTEQIQEPPRRKR